MKSLGIDIGSLNVKFVILQDGKVGASGVAPAGEQAEDALRQLIDGATGGSFDPSAYAIVATGAGAKSLSFSPQQKSITTCLARGFNHTFPAVRTGIDMGAESCSVVKISDRGRVNEWANHDKCASGTGVFLQQMAKLMQVPIAEMAALSLNARKRADISGTCAVFAESEVISHVHRVPPTPKEEIVAGIYGAVVGRIMAMCKRVGIQKEVGVSGGVALNNGLVRILESELGFNVLRPERPELIAALGAAVIAGENTQKAKI